MAQPIGYFTQCDQGQELVNRFGDRDLAGLSQVDQAALVAALGGFLLASINGTPLSLEESAFDFVLNFDAYEVGDEFNEAIAILEGITQPDALAVIGFLVQ